MVVLGVLWASEAPQPFPSAVRRSAGSGQTSPSTEPSVPSCAQTCCSPPSRRPAAAAPRPPSPSPHAVSSASELPTPAQSLRRIRGGCRDGVKKKTTTSELLIRRITTLPTDLGPAVPEVVSVRRSPLVDPFVALDVNVIAVVHVSVGR